MIHSITYWPKSGCSILVHCGTKVLLVKRGKDPFKGCWSLPGGIQKAGETLEECARRELFEETGLVAKVLEFSITQDRIKHDKSGTLAHHFVLTTFRCSTFSGELQAGDDAAQADWFSMDALDNLPQTPGLAKCIRVIFARLADPDYSLLPLHDGQR